MLDGTAGILSRSSVKNTLRHAFAGAALHAEHIIRVDARCSMHLLQLEVASNLYTSRLESV